MTGEADVAVVERALRGRLGDVVQQGTPAHGQGDVHVAIELLGERRGHGWRRRAGGELGVLAQVDRRVQHLQRVVKHVEVVVAVLLDAIEGLDLGQDNGEQAQVVEATQPVDRVPRQQDALCLLYTSPSPRDS